MITMFWGGTFLAVQYAVSLSGPLFFVGLRFATAALAVGLLSLRTLRGLTWLEVKAGVAIGVAIALGYGLQTWGLQTISSSKSAFITAMYVPLVPLLQWLCLGRMPGVMSCVGIVLAFIGLILLAGPENNLLALVWGGDRFCMRGSLPRKTREALRDKDLGRTSRICTAGRKMRFCYDLCDEFCTITDC